MLLGRAQEKFSKYNGILRFNSNNSQKRKENTNVTRDSSSKLSKYNGIQISTDITSKIQGDQIKIYSYVLLVQCQ